MDFFHQDQLQIPRHLALTVMWSNLSWCFAEKIEVLCNPQDHKKVHVHSPAGPLLSKEHLPCWIRDLSILSSFRTVLRVRLGRSLRQGTAARSRTRHGGTPRYIQRAKQRCKPSRTPGGGRRCPRCHGLTLGSKLLFFVSYQRLD
jgi:hypothetical protein